MLAFSEVMPQSLLYFYISYSFLLFFLFSDLFIEKNGPILILFCLYNNKEKSILYHKDNRIVIYKKKGFYHA